MDKNTEQSIISDYQNGMSGVKLSLKYGYSNATIYKIIKKFGIIRDHSEIDRINFIKKYPQITYNILIELYTDTIVDLSKKLNLDKQVIRRLLIAYNIQIRDINMLNSVRDKRSDIMKKVMKDESIRKNVSENPKNVWRSRGYKPHPNTLKSMNTDTYRNKMANVTKNRHKTEWHDKIKPLISNGLIKCWRDNSHFRDKITEHARKWMSRIKVNDEFYKKWKEQHQKAMLDPEFRKRRSNAIKLLWQDDEYRQKILMQRVNQPVVSTQQRMLYDFLDELNIKYIPEYVIGYYSFDCFLPDYNILIEVNGDYWHNLPRTVRNDKSKSTYISEYFKQYQLKYLWEHEFKCYDRIIELIKYWCNINTEKKQFSFDDVIIRDCPTDDVKIFLGKYHYLHKTGNNKIKLGFYLGDILIGLVIYGPITRNESATRLGLKPGELLELTRLCIHPGYQIKNFASWMISKSIKLIKNKHQHIKKLISFADSTFNHDGVIYKASNWKLDGIVEPSYWYVDKDGYVMHKKTLWDHAKSLKMTEQQFASDYGYNRVDGMQKYRYIYEM
jgi:hypothetical protein